MFVRAVAAPDGQGSIVTVGGLARTDSSGGFEEEFAELSAELAESALPPEPRQPGKANNQSETGA
jgi:hypothetical protein